MRSQLVRLFAVGSCLETFCGLSCVFSTRCLIFGISDDLSHHLWRRSVLRFVPGYAVVECCEQFQRSCVHDLFRALCVVNFGLWDHLIHFFVRALLTSQAEKITSRLLGNAISPAPLCDFRVLTEVAGLYLDNTHVVQLCLMFHSGQLGVLGISVAGQLFLCVLLWNRLRA